MQDTISYTHSFLPTQQMLKFYWLDSSALVFNDEVWTTLEEDDDDEVNRSIASFWAGAPWRGTAMVLMSAQFSLPGHI